VAISETDVLLLGELQRDCHQGLKELSKKLSLPLSTVHGKIRKFEEENIIEGYHASINAEKVGQNVTAYVLVQCVMGDTGGKMLYPQEVARKISALPFVLECHLVTGPYDLVVKLKGKSMRQIGNLLMENIWKMPGVRNTQTLEAFYTAKETQTLDLSLFGRE